MSNILSYLHTKYISIVQYSIIQWPILICSQHLLRSLADVKKGFFLFKFQRIATIKGLGSITLSQLKRERLHSLAKHVITIRISYKEIVKTKIVFQWVKIFSYQCKKLKQCLIHCYLLGAIHKLCCLKIGDF